MAFGERTAEKQAGCLHRGIPTRRRVTQLPVGATGTGHADETGWRRMHAAAPAPIVPVARSYMGRRPAQAVPGPPKNAPLATSGKKRSLSLNPPPLLGLDGTHGSDEPQCGLAT